MIIDKVIHSLHNSRRSKATQVVQSDDIMNTKNDKDGVTAEAENHSSELLESVKTVKPRKVASLSIDLADKENCSERQRVARTVILGGLLNADMAEDVPRLAREVGTICSVCQKKSLPSYFWLFMLCNPNTNLILELTKTFFLAIPLDKRVIEFII
ncbi:hypothetical protein ACOSP7_027840 [Xanthoceras sorbifolium]